MGETVIIAMSAIAIVLIAGISINGIVEKVMSAKRMRHEPRPALQSANVRENTERQQMIEHLLRVLERIPPDRGRLLADEIEALRGNVPALGKEPAQ